MQWTLSERNRLRFPLESYSLQILPYFFYNFFIFVQWLLILVYEHYIIKSNTILYWFLLKILKIVGNSSIVLRSMFIPPMFIPPLNIFIKLQELRVHIDNKWNIHSRGVPREWIFHLLSICTLNSSSLVKMCNGGINIGGTAKVVLLSCGSIWRSLGPLSVLWSWAWAPGSIDRC